MTNRTPSTGIFSHLLVRLMLCLMLLLLAACGGDEPPATQTATLAAPPTATSQPAAAPEQPTPEPPTVAATSACEEYFQFCVTINISGSLSATVTTGSAGTGSDCPTWAAADAPRILELPFVVAAGESKITVALTRVGAYQGPGRYELAAATTTGMPDAFPAIEVAGRTFSNGAGSAAVVTVAPYGSGEITASGLVELASIQVARPRPSSPHRFFYDLELPGLRQRSELPNG